MPNSLQRLSLQLFTGLCGSAKALGVQTDTLGTGKWCVRATAGRQGGVTMALLSRYENKEGAPHRATGGIIK